MSETVEDVYPEMVVRRIEPADLNVIGEWLISRIQERHPNATPIQIMSWLRGCCFANDKFFVRTDHAVALAELRRVPLEVYPEGWETFVFADSDEWMHEAADLYPHMASWAANQEARRLHVDIWTDVSRARIATRLGPHGTRKNHGVYPLYEDA